MKGIFVILDGLGDLPNKILDEKTPLEVASTPNMDFFASRGELGYLYPVKPAFVPESDEALLSIFGNTFHASLRGPLEATGEDIVLEKGDLAVRVNFATVDVGSENKIIDRRAGRTLTNKDTNSFTDALNLIKLPCKFIFKPTFGHRGILVLRGGLSGEVSGNDLTYSQGRFADSESVGFCKSLDDSEIAKYSADVLNEFVQKAHDVLKKHPVNINRVKRGLMPANYLLVRGPGVGAPKLKKYSGWLAFSYSPLEKGFAKASEMRMYSFNYPKFSKLDFYEHSRDGLSRACKNAVKVIKKNYKDYNYAYIHFKETDTPGHDNKPHEKKEMIEAIDSLFFGFLRKFCPSKKIKVLVSSDHSTPCKLKTHSADPVPVLFYDPTVSSLIREKSFSEKEARRGALGRFEGHELLKKTGFVK